jgi:hypothetical protein
MFDHRMNYHSIFFKSLPRKIITVKCFEENKNEYKNQNKINIAKTK